jgi:hypothetical protein
MNADGDNTVDLENRSTNTKTFVEITIVGEDKRELSLILLNIFLKMGEY